MPSLPTLDRSCHRSERLFPRFPPQLAGGLAAMQSINRHRFIQHEAVQRTMWPCQPTPDTEVCAEIMTDHKILTAYHEAGHAVMALLMGRSVQKVSIIPSQNRLGACTLQKGRAKQVPDKLEAEILILLAGMAAEGRKSGSYNVQGASQDLQAVEKLAMARSGNLRQATKLVHRMLDKTQHLLADKGTWTAIKVIAAELIEHESLSGRAARHHLTLAQNQSN